MPEYTRYRRFFRKSEFGPLSGQSGPDQVFMEVSHKLQRADIHRDVGYFEHFRGQVTAEFRALVQDDIGPPPVGQIQYVFRDTQGDPVTEELRHVHPVERGYVPVEQKSENRCVEIAVGPSYSHVHGLDAVVAVQPGAPLLGCRNADIVAMSAQRVGQCDQSAEVGFELVDGHQHAYAICPRKCHVRSVTHWGTTP
ncbi:hypothetical protein [Nocardia sp. NPDC047654]|uniref:hypothetical protein n=1 Tax=Nocardia sp. NPDC047654 TaxID=3364314 RepID=UPI0037140B78